MYRDCHILSSNFHKSSQKDWIAIKYPNYSNRKDYSFLFKKFAHQVYKNLNPSNKYLIILTINKIAFLMKIIMIFIIKKIILIIKIITVFIIKKIILLIINNIVLIININRMITIIWNRSEKNRLSHKRRIVSFTNFDSLNFFTRNCFNFFILPPWLSLFFVMWKTSCERDFFFFDQST